jgi:peptide deformylase
MEVKTEISLMAKANNKTQAEPTLSAKAFLDSVEDETKRKDSQAILKMMEKATGAKAVMWGANIIGFGDKHLVYESGREMDWFEIGFSPRKKEITLYIGLGTNPQTDLLSRLGKHKTGKGCLYIAKLADVDMKVLEQLINESAKRDRK